MSFDCRQSQNGIAPCQVETMAHGCGYPAIRSPMNCIPDQIGQKNSPSSHLRSSAKSTLIWGLDGMKNNDGTAQVSKRSWEIK